MGNILVTGGAGFIGSHLVEHLVSLGYSVVVVDNLSRGKIENISAVLQDVQFINTSILNYEKISELIKSSDIVFHLAALSRVLPSIKNPNMCFEYNVRGTEIIARLSSKYGKKLIFASSREVYGSAKYLPVDESHPLDPENPYGASKVAGEKIIEVYSKCYGLNYVTIRLANVYGPRDFDRVIPIFIERTLKGEDLIVYGGDKILDFVYIDDIVNAFIKAIDISGNYTLNIGSGTGTRILELAKLIKKLVGGIGDISVKEKRKGEVENFVADIRKAREVLGWKPRVELEEGVNQTFLGYLIHKR